MAPPSVGTRVALWCLFAWGRMMGGSHCPQPLCWTGPAGQAPRAPESVSAVALGHFREQGAVEPKWYVIRMLYFVENKNVSNWLVSGKSNWDSEIHIFPCSALNLLISEKRTFANINQMSSFLPTCPRYP